MVKQFFIFFYRLFSLLIYSNACILAHLAKDVSAGMPFIKECEKFASEFFGSFIKEKESVDFDEMEKRIADIRNMRVVIGKDGLKIEKIDERD